MPGVGGQEQRCACEFGIFFKNPDGAATPSHLLSRSPNIYAEIAIGLKGGPWREVSMVNLAIGLGMGPEQPVKVSEEDQGGVVLQKGPEGGPPE